VSQSSTMQRLAARVAALREMSPAQRAAELRAAIARVDAEWTAASHFPPIFDRSELQVTSSTIDESSITCVQGKEGLYVVGQEPRSVFAGRDVPAVADPGWVDAA